MVKRKRKRDVLTELIQMINEAIEKYDRKIKKALRKKRTKNNLKNDIGTKRKRSIFRCKYSY